jgi:hypothetical protein
MTEKKTRPATRDEKIVNPGVYDVPAETPAPQKKIGRPTKYSEELAQVICIRLSGGESLRSICKDDDFPVQQTVYSWMLKHPSFLEQYTRAREEQADTYADEIVAIADEAPEINPVYDKDGNVIDVKIDSGYVAYQKQRIEARKWTAMKLKPKKYGDKITHSGDDDNPVVIENNMNVFGELLKNLKMKRQSEE